MDRRSVARWIAALAGAAILLVVVALVAPLVPAPGALGIVFGVLAYGCVCAETMRQARAAARAVRIEYEAAPFAATFGMCSVEK